MAHLHEAIRAYQRGFYLRNDYYNGINFAYLLNVRAAAASHQAEAEGLWRRPLAFAQTRSLASFRLPDIRRDVLQICQTVLDSEKLSNHDSTGSLQPWRKPISELAMRNARNRHSMKPSLWVRRRG